MDGGTGVGANSSPPSDISASHMCEFVTFRLYLNCYSKVFPAPQYEQSHLPALQSPPLRDPPPPTPATDPFQHDGGLGWGESVACSMPQVLAMPTEAQFLLVSQLHSRKLFLHELQPVCRRHRRHRLRGLATATSNPRSLSNHLHPRLRLRRQTPRQQEP